MQGHNNSVRETVEELYRNIMSIFGNFLYSGVVMKRVMIFFSSFQISLWGNKCDLALSAGESSSQKANIINSLKDLKPFILVNETESLWALLSKLKKTAEPPKVRVDIVLDNSGFELVTDLVFADFLLSSELATEIHFMGKPSLGLCLTLLCETLSG